MSGIAMYYKLMKIYSKLWRYPSFEEEFMKAYPAEWQMLKEENYLALDDFDIISCYKFALEWEPDEEEFMD